jgi:hypothetical protein
MSWGTDVKIEDGELYLIRESYSTKYEVEQAIKETEETIEQYKSRLKMLIAGDVRTFADKDCDIAWWIENEVNDIMESIQEGVTNNFIRQILVDNWEFNQKKEE